MSEPNSNQQADRPSDDDEYSLAPLPEDFQSAQSAAYRPPVERDRTEAYEVGDEVDPGPFSVGSQSWHEAASGVRREVDEFGLAPVTPVVRPPSRASVLRDVAKKMQEAADRRIGDPDDPQRFTLRGLFAVLTMVSLVLALGIRFSRPVFAGIVGVAALFTLFVARWIRVGSAVVMLAWWTLLGVYVLVAMFAMLGL
jgi:hypothetical protein